MNITSFLQFTFPWLGIISIPNSFLEMGHFNNVDEKYDRFWYSLYIYWKYNKGYQIKVYLAFCYERIPFINNIKSFLLFIEPVMVHEIEVLWSILRLTLGKFEYRFTSLKQDLISILKLQSLCAERRLYGVSNAQIISLSPIIIIIFVYIHFYRIFTGICTAVHSLREMG